MMTKSMTKSVVKKINVADLPTFEVSNYLRDDEEMALYLSAMLEDGTQVQRYFFVITQVVGNFKCG